MFSLSHTTKSLAIFICRLYTTDPYNKCAKIRFVTSQERCACQFVKFRINVCIICIQCIYIHFEGDEKHTAAYMARESKN